MTTTETPLADRFTTVTLGGSGVTVTAERTACPFLVIAPVIDRNGLTETVTLVHTRTGSVAPGGLMSTPADLRTLAAAVAHLDWDFDDPTAAPKATIEGFKAARFEFETSNGERFVAAYPDGWQDNPRKIPGTADAMVRWLLDSYWAISDRTFGLGPEVIPASIDDKINPEFVTACREKTDLFGLIYLLATLRRVAPTVADHATAFLAGQWDYGDSLGEWVWQWREEIEKGEPLKLPAVPSPEVPDGEFLS